MPVGTQFFQYVDALKQSRTTYLTIKRVSTGLTIENLLKRLSLVQES